MTCKSRNLLYIIQCGKCKELYIGETGCTLQARIRVHKQHINVPEYRQIQLSEHLDECGQKVFSVFPFFKLYTDDALTRKEKERHFINLFKPSLNSIK